MRYATRGEWQNVSQIEHMNFECGFCGAKTASKVGYFAHVGGSKTGARVYPCGACHAPNYFNEGEQFPAPAGVGDIEHLRPDLQALWKEARFAFGATAYTAAVLTCRKILMHAAHGAGAAPDLRFIEYVDFLDAGHHVPAGSRGWVDYIRRASNEANHEIVVSNKESSAGVMRFTEALLRTMYELPNKIPS